MLGEEHAARDLTDLVTGAPDTLQGAGHGGGRLDLHHEVDGAHVDAELEAARRDHAREPSALEVVLDDGSLLLGDRAVVGAGDQRARRPPSCRSAPVPRPGGAACAAGTLAGAARPTDVAASARSVASSLSRAVSRSARRRELAKTIVERCCSIRSRTRLSTWGHSDPARWTAVVPLLAELGHVLDGHDDLEVPLLLRRGRDHLDRSGTAEEARDLVDGADRGGQTDALGGLVEELVEPLERDREVGTPLGAGDGVDLVDDHRLDADERLAGAGGEHQEQRLGGGDQDVGRRATGCGDAPVAWCRPSARRRGPRAPRLPEPLGGLADADERGAQVALDVHGERLERRDVEHPAALLLLRHGLRGQLVDRPQEGATASCRSRWGPPPGRAGPPRWRPRRRSARWSAPRTRRRTTCGSPH